MRRLSPAGFRWRQAALASLAALLIIASTAAPAFSATMLHAVPPSTATQPLYVCKLDVSELAEYDGTPTPDMLAANYGLNAALTGMLQQWGTSSAARAAGEGVGVAAGEASPAEPSLLGAWGRALLSGSGAGAQSCGSGTPTPAAGATGRAAFGPAAGFDGPPLSSTGVAPPDPTIAVGPDTALLVVNSLVLIYRLEPGTGRPKGGSANNANTAGGAGGADGSAVPAAPATVVPLPAFFQLVAYPCDGGVFGASVAYDEREGRFLLSAVCGGDANQLVLAASATPSALGQWALYSFAGEITQPTPMACRGYPYALRSQVGYNRDAVLLSFVQNCPENQETATGAVLLALPKWAVYKGATYFWAPAWTAWDVQAAAGLAQSDAYYPGAFLQLQPVAPQRPEDVQAEVAYFVCDNLNYNAPLQRTELLLAALINTGSLWLYEGPGSSSPSPLLVARLVPRGTQCLAVPATQLTQPVSTPACQRLHAGAMRPPGFWDGGAALYNNRIYLADRGPDRLDPAGAYHPTVYWAMLAPSFCVSGPCAPWFGADWGWSSGWDWRTGRWAASSDRGAAGFADPGYANQVYLFPSAGSSSSSVGRRRRRLAAKGEGEGEGEGEGGQGGAARDALGAPAAADASAALPPAAPLAAGPLGSRKQVRAAVAASQARLEALQAAADAAAASAAASAGGAQPADYQAAVRAARGGRPGPRIAFRGAAAANASAGGPQPAPSPAAPPAGEVSASSLLLLVGSFIFKGFAGWGLGFGSYYSSYYQAWKSYFLLRSLSINAGSIPPRVNPCKYYKSWAADNTVTFGALVTASGVIDFATGQAQEPVGLAFPAVAVRGGAMAVVYSFAGPGAVPGTNGTLKAYPGVAMTTIPPARLTPSAAAAAAFKPSLQLLRAGEACVSQGAGGLWGAYSGIDVQQRSSRVWAAVEYAAGEPWPGGVPSNAGIWVSMF